MKGILEGKVGSIAGEGEEELMREKWVFWRCTQIQKKRGLVGHEAMNFGGPILTPINEVIALQLVVVGFVINTKIIGWGGDNKIHALGS
jgi:hypothetical protein